MAARPGLPWALKVVMCAASIFVASCSSVDPAVGGGTPIGRAPSAEGTSVASTGQAFGRVRYFYKGKEVEFGFFRFLLFVRSQRTGEIHQKFFIGGRGTFNWSLPSGEYVIVGYNYLNETGRLWLSFSVPNSGEAVYIGDLHILSSDGRYGWQIHDAYADAEKEFGAEFAKSGVKTTVALMKSEEKLGSYRRMTNVCAATEWGTECDVSNQGVKPLSPVQAALGFPKVDSLTPRLEWSPVDRKGVTYDLAVYESIQAPLLGLSHIRGKLVSYVEALPQPFYQFDTPLARGKQYEWSVRLRSGDTVSTWSTTGYFVFFVVGTASGSGNWFGFSTPD